MPNNFCLTVRFLQPYSHGRGGDGEPEWPPSPLRVFQALVAAAAARWNERFRLEYAAAALRWLEGQPAPMIVAAPGVRSDVKYRLYVPDNVADKVAKAWSGGREASIADYRTEKDVQPIHLMGEAVHYLYPLSADGCPHFDILSAAAQSITHLGWGVDMVAGNAVIVSEADATKLPGERWRPIKDSAVARFRTPITGTLDVLLEKHRAFLSRLGPDGFHPVPPLTVFDTIDYRRDTDVSPRPLAGFEIWRPVAELANLLVGRSRFRPFDPVPWTPRVAGLVRHAVAAAAQSAGWPTERINTFIHGHTPDGAAPARGDGASCRFSYIPLPSLERRGEQGVHVGMIRRVLIVGPPDGTEEITWVRRALSGQELIPQGLPDPVAMLSVISGTDRNVQPYLRPSVVWSTVTPVVLPGYDDPNHLRRRLNDVRNAADKRRLHERLDARIEELLRSAIVQAGFPIALAESAELSWRLVGFWPGLARATEYTPPDYLKGRPRYHVRICWRDAAGCPVRVPGPVVIGAGRHRGLGLFAADES